MFIKIKRIKAHKNYSDIKSKEKRYDSNQEENTSWSQC